MDRHDRKKIMIGADLIIAAAGAVLAIVAFYMEPVSYTHLDVYKRQVPVCLHPLCPPHLIGSDTSGHRGGVCVLAGHQVNASLIQ